MSTFITSLWDSIFTPGPTAPLLYATNLSFAALQLVLLGLLFATKSIHCVVLSGLCQKIDVLAKCAYYAL
ncbi:hypothetical protein E4U28_005615 [Claviceps purpurea]|nr:hypothetical protein E4U28_005615 [Claviceps purpurea]